MHSSFEDPLPHPTTYLSLFSSSTFLNRFAHGFSTRFQKTVVAGKKM